MIQANELKCGIPANEYANIHAWLRYNFGNANKCESESCKGNSKKFHWALKKGFEYEKKRENFFMLCVSCHLKYDWTPKKTEILFGNMTDERRNKISKARKKMKMSDETKRKLSIRFSGEGNPMYGVSMSGEESAWFGKKHTEETKAKIFAHRAKLTKEQVESIRNEVASGVMQKIIALKYSISRTCICRIINNKRYRLI